LSCIVRGRCLLSVGFWGTYRDEAAAPALKAGRAALDSIVKRCEVCEGVALSAGGGPD
jgi:hypothetical protein